MTHAHGKEARVPKFPQCDFCDELAQYDFSMRAGRWAFGCEKHWKAFSFGILGTGMGQKLVLEDAGKRAAEGESAV